MYLYLHVSIYHLNILSSLSSATIDHLSFIYLFGASIIQFLSIYFM